MVVGGGQEVEAVRSGRGGCSNPTREGGGLAQSHKVVEQQNNQILQVF